MSLESFFVVEKNYNMLVPWYLIAAHRYYVMDDPILEDHHFDKMAKLMLEHWDNITHNHKHYLSKDMLEAGTFIGDYPSIVEDVSKETFVKLNKKDFTKKVKQIIL